MIRAFKIDAIDDCMHQYDVVNGITGTIKIRDTIGFNDSCYKVEKEEHDDV